MNIAWPVYGPKGGSSGVSIAPRTSVPTNPISVPEDWATPPSVTSAVKVIVSAHRVRSNSKGGEGDGDDSCGDGDGDGS